ncbi:MAG: hypothetical protein HC884_16820, partial [Chloroflexaceae bacterium]|nr:hypothetical protein [Chloroflexaceae bacterium]
MTTAVYQEAEHDPHLLQGVSPELRNILSRTVRVAARMSENPGGSLWLVGGVVRDLLLALPIERDIDLVVEGDAIALAHALAAHLGGDVAASHEPFGTATVVLEAGPPGPALHLDLAMARIETYPHPAALPVVQPTTIAHDLARRDFSINAMALEILATDEGDVFPGRLLDPFTDGATWQRGCCACCTTAASMTT